MLVDCYVCTGFRTDTKRTVQVRHTSRKERLTFINERIQLGVPLPYFRRTLMMVRADYNFDESDFPDSAHRKKSRRSCLYKLPLRYCISIQVRLFTRLVVSFCCFIPLVYSALSFGNVTTVSPVFHSSCSLGVTVSSDGVSTCTMVLFLFFLYTRHRSTSSVCFHTLLVIACSLPITSAEAERSFSLKGQWPVEEYLHKR